MSTMNNALEEAVAAARGPARLAKLLSEAGFSISRPTVYDWIKAGRCSAPAARYIERVTGVPAAKLRPDLYG